MGRRFKSEDGGGWSLSSYYDGPAKVGPRTPSSSAVISCFFRCFGWSMTGLRSEGRSTGEDSSLTHSKHDFLVVERRNRRDRGRGAQPEESPKSSRILRPASSSLASGRDR